MEVASLQAMLAVKESEAEEMRAQLRSARMEVEGLSQNLEAVGIAGHSSSSLVPDDMQAGKDLADGMQLELRRLLQWLATSVDLSQHVVFDCGAGKGLMQVGSRSVNMHRMVAWQLPSSEGLKLSVPIELQAEVATLLSEAQTRGRFLEPVLQNFAAGWELVSAEVAAAPGVVEPAIFLVCCETSQAIVCARWPLLDFGGPATCCVGSCAPFDPAKHFCELPALVAADASSNEAGSRPRSDSVWSTGDRVEVEWEGEWFTGVLQWVHGDVANVKCDVDEPGVTTDASIDSVRPARDVGARPPPLRGELCSTSPLRSKTCHMRAKSIG